MSETPLWKTGSKLVPSLLWLCECEGHRCERVLVPAQVVPMCLPEGLLDRWTRGFLNIWVHYQGLPKDRFTQTVPLPTWYLVITPSSSCLRFAGKLHNIPVYRKEDTFLFRQPAPGTGAVNHSCTCTVRGEGLTHKAAPSQ